MKKFIKAVIIGTLLFATGFSAFAQSSKIKQESGKVILVGKINVIYDENRDFIFKTRGVDQKLAEKADTYSVPYITDPEDKFSSHMSEFYSKNQTTYPVGDFFMLNFRIPKKGEQILRFRKYFTMNFFDSVQAKVYLPLPEEGFDVDIPEGVEALYFGTLNYYVTGDNFTIANIEKIDEYELAQEELDRSLGKHVDMARAVLKIVETPDPEEVDAK